MVERRVGKRYDLHTHSSVSDGTTPPREIADEVAAAGLAGFSLTDHDTTAGWFEARQAAKRLGIDFLPGIELTTSHRGRSIHLLAYGIDEEDEQLRHELDTLVTSRRERAEIMIRRLKPDFELDWEAVLESSEALGQVTLGRPHLADALVGAGYFRTRSDAFDQVLNPRTHYYVPTYATETTEAIELVRDAGGFPVLAHPAAFRMRAPIDVRTVELFASLGLGGVELDHPENRKDWLPPIREVVERGGLVITGSSDFHGLGKPNRIGDGTSSAETVALIRSQVATPY